MFPILFAPLLLSSALLLVGSKAQEPAQPAADKMVQVVYPVADLVIPMAQAPSKSSEQAPVAQPSAAPAASCTTAPPVQTREKPLMELIRYTIAPTSWSEAGGQGAITYFPLGLGLHVYNTPEVQEQVADLLESLRKLADQEVAVEVRLLRVSDSFFDRLGADSDITPVVPPTAEGNTCSDVKPLAFLNGKQMRELLKAAQGDPQASTMQAPRLTVLNGQQANIEITQQQFFVTGVKVECKDQEVFIVPENKAFSTGFRMSVLPVVSADRRTVLVKLKADQTDLNAGPVPIVPVTTQMTTKTGEVVPFRLFLQQPSFQTLKADKSLRIADCQTAVLRWGTLIVEGRNEYGPPLVSNVPYLGRLFRTVAYSRERQTLLLLVTPRIIVNEQQEDVFSPRSEAAPAY
jgi:general secretion pathway protein D